MRINRASEMTIPSATGSAPPERPVPAPRATNGIRSALQSRTTACTSSTLPGSATSAGTTRWPVRPSHSYVRSCSGSRIVSVVAANRSSSSDLIPRPSLTPSKLGHPSRTQPAEERSMPRPVTLFTGQWADLPIEDLAAKAGGWGFDGLELACWGDHFEVDKALADEAYCRSRQEILERNHLNVFAIGAHLVGQAVCDRIDERHRAILPPEVYGDGEPEGVRGRAAERMKDSARAAARLGIRQVNGFTGSPIWHLIYSFPPNDFAEIERAYEDFAERWNPIMDVFDAEGVTFGLEVHPSEIAYDFVTTRNRSATPRSSRLSSRVASTPYTWRTRRSGSTGVARSSARTSTPARSSA